MTSRLETAGRQEQPLQVEPWILSLVAEALPMAVRRSGAEGGCTYVNRRWLSLTGRRLQEELGAGWADALHPDDRDVCLELLAIACEAQQPLTMAYRLRRRDGAWRWLHEQAAPCGDGEGGFGGFLHAAFDVTEQKLSEGRLRQLVDRQQVSLEELRHRAINRSQLILSLLRLQAREAADAGARAALEVAATRVQALALTDRRLDSGQEAGVAPTLGRCLQELAAALQPSFEQRGIRLQVSVDDSEVPSRVAAPLALLVNELLINSLKHAFPEPRSGTVKLIGMKAGASLKVVVADDGVGLPEKPGRRRGRSSGMWLIDGLAKQIDAEVTIERDHGTCFVLTVPIDRAAALAAGRPPPP
jgi:PAS domain S-box-containing protein